MLSRTIELYRNSFHGLSRDIWVLAGITFINRAGAMVLPFLTVYLTNILSFSLKDTGIVMSCFGVGSIVGTYAGGWMTDKWGFYRIQVSSLILGGCMFFVLMYVHTLFGFCVTIFFTSMIADTFRPATMVAIDAYSRPENRTRSVSLIRFAINLGFAAGPALGGLLASSLGYAWLFMIDGVTCIIAALILKLALSPKRLMNNQLGDKVASGEKVAEKSSSQVLSAYKDHTYLMFIFCQLICAVAFMQWFSTVPVYLNLELHLPENYIGALLALNGLLIVIVEMPLIYILENKYNSLSLIGFGMICVAVSFLVFQLLPYWMGWLVASMILLTIGEIIVFPFGNSFALDRSKLGMGGQYMGLYTMSFSVAHVLAPLIGMQLAEWKGFETLWLSMAFTGMIGFIGLMGLKRHLSKSAVI